MVIDLEPAGPESQRGRLASAQAEGRTVRFERAGRLDQFTSGYVLEVAGELALIQQFLDFQPFGYKMIRIADVVGVRDGENERFLERVLSDQGLNPAPLPWLQIGDWRSVLLSLMKVESELAAIEYALTDSAEDELMVGLPSEIERDSAWVLPCDSLAAWASEEEALQLDSITSVELRTPYLKTLARYLAIPDQEGNG